MSVIPIQYEKIVIIVSYYYIISEFVPSGENGKTFEKINVTEMFTKLDSNQNEIIEPIEIDDSLMGSESHFILIKLT